jgi:predicted ATPase
LLGYFDQAQICIDELRPDAPIARATALMAAWFFGWNVGSEPKWLLQNADELLALADEKGFAGWRALGTMQRGCSLAALGHVGEGVAQITTGLADYRATGTVLGVPSFLTWMADAHLMAGQPHVGQEQLAEALQLCRVTEEHTSEAETLRLRGELLISTGDRATAEGSFCEALALARQQSAKLWELRAATSLAQLWRDQGKRTEANDLLTSVYGWFTEGFDTGVLKHAKALLDELNDGVSPAIAGRAITTNSPTSG